MLKGFLFTLFVLVSFNISAGEQETVEVDTDNKPQECIEYWYLDSVV